LRRRGLTVVETIIASFLLVGGLLITVALFHTSLRYTAQAEQVVVATTLAQRTLNEMRSWARTPANYRSAWSPYHNITVADPQHPTFLIRTEVSQSGGQPHPLLASPCTSLDGLYPATQQRQLANSARRVRVTVTWPPYSAGSTYRLVSLVEEPRLTWRATNPIVVNVSNSGPLNRNGTSTITAQGYDNSGQPIPDLVYSFYVEPGDPASMADISQTRQGRSATLTHILTLLSGSPTYGPAGQVIVTARAVYKGEERWGSSAPIGLQ
jgi:hypothetical protein